jgi:hypothetical protein
MTYPDGGRHSEPPGDLHGDRYPSGRADPGVHPTGGPAPGYLEGGRAILAALDAASAAERTGTAWLMGQNAGALHFRGGRVVGAELAGRAWCAALLVASGRLTTGEWDEFERSWSRPPAEPRPGAPPARGMGILEWSAVALGGTVDAAFELLPTSRDEIAGDMVFQADRIPAWTGSVRGVGLSWLRREIDRRQSVLDRLRGIVTPDSALARAAPEWAGPVQVSAQQWRVMSAVSDGSTARSIGRRIGLGTFATTVAVRALMMLGMIAVPDAPVGSAFSRTLFTDAASARS